MNPITWLSASLDGWKFCLFVSCCEVICFCVNSFLSIILAITTVLLYIISKFLWLKWAIEAKIFLEVMEHLFIFFNFPSARVEKDWKQNLEQSLCKAQTDNHTYHKYTLNQRISHFLWKYFPKYWGDKSQ